MPEQTPGVDTQLSFLAHSSVNSNLLIHRSPLRELRPDPLTGAKVFSITIVPRSNRPTFIDLRSEVSEVIARANLVRESAMFQLTKDGFSLLSIPRGVFRLAHFQAGVDIINIAGREFSHNLTTKGVKGIPITYDSLKRTLINPGSGIDNLKSLSVIVSSSSKQALLRVTIANHATLKTFENWARNQIRDRAWLNDVAIPCPAFSPNEGFVVGDSSCNPAEWRSPVKNGRFAVSHHPGPENSTIFEFRQRTEKGKTSGGQEVYVCNEGETLCHRAISYPTAGTPDRGAPGSAKNPLTYPKFARHFIKDVRTGCRAEILDGYANCQTPLPPARPGKFMSLYLAARPISTGEPKSSALAGIKTPKKPLNDTSK